MDLVRLIKITISEKLAKIETKISSKKLQQVMKELAENTPTSFVYIGKSISDDKKHPSEFGMNNELEYEAFRRIWDKYYDNPLPDYQTATTPSQLELPQ